MRVIHQGGWSLAGASFETQEVDHCMFLSCCSCYLAEKEFSICPLLHTWAHKQKWLTPVTLIDRGESNTIPPTPSQGWLWHTWDSNSYSPNNRLKFLFFVVAPLRRTIMLFKNCWLWMVLISQTEVCNKVFSCLLCHQDVYEYTHWHMTSKCLADFFFFSG